MQIKVRIEASGCANRGALFLSILLCAGSVFGQGKADFSGGDFSGTIGKSRISMKLGRSLPQRFGRFSDLDRQFPKLQRLEGFYYYDRYQQDILLLGYLDEQSNITISEYAAPGKPPTGVFKGSLSGGMLHGRWESPDEKRSVEFELTATQKLLRTGQEAENISHRNQELAAQSANEKDFAKTIFYLTLSRVEVLAATQSLEEFFQAALDGKLDAFKEKLASCRKESRFEFELTLVPSAFLAERNGDFGRAKQLYRGSCVPPRLYSQPVTFSCLMYAALGERIGDRKAALEGYDLACHRTQSMCGKASGPDEAQLIAAIQDKKPAVIETLLAKPVNVNANNGQVLMSAVLAGNSKLVQTLVERGADPNLSDGQILELAIVNDHIDIASFLLDHGADPDAFNSGEAHALYDAVAIGNIPLIEKIISKGANINDNDYVAAGTALIRAAEDNQFEIVKLLLDRGADPTIKAKFHDSPMEATSDPEIKRLLSEAIASCRSGVRKCESPN
jgi:hypothetical protein